MTTPTRRQFISSSAGLACTALLAGAAPAHSNSKTPNIVWFNVEDMSCHFGFQGEPLVKTPHVDRLASEGAVYTNAYVTCPVCSPSRSALITGMYQTAIGAHHHRSARGEVKNILPSHIKTLPELFKGAGYYVCNGSQNYKKGKTDYNFEYDDQSLYDGPDWSERKAGQPFFAQVQLSGGKKRGSLEKWNQKCKAELDNYIKPEDVALPPYYPDTKPFRDDWAAYLNTVQYTDQEVGGVIEQLKQENLLDNTIIFFFTDHGVSQARGKQFNYDEGAKVPLIVWDGRTQSHSVRDELVAHIDIAATSLYFAGIDIPKLMQGRPLFGPQANPREYVVTARDRCDETTDRIRSVRKRNYKYIRNFYPERPYLQPNVYKDNKPWMQHYRDLGAQGKLNQTQMLQLAETRPEEELYDVSKDKWEINNLAGDPDYREVLRELRADLANWVIESDDQGRMPEPQSMFDSDMKAYSEGKVSRGQIEGDKQLQKNIAILNHWKAEGK